MDYLLMQKEHAVWVDSVYPRQTPDVPAIGLVEEAGELVHALLKLQQRQTWGEESRYPLASLHDKLVDAIGDVAIYACSFCNASHWDFNKIVLAGWLYAANEAQESPMHVAAEAVGIAADFAIKGYSKHLLTTLLGKLIVVADLHDLCFDDCVAKTWAKVKERKRA